MKKENVISHDFNKLISYVFFGVFFWVFTVIVIRYLGSLIFLNEFYKIAFFILTILVSDSLIKTNRIISKSYGKIYLLPIVIMVAICIFMSTFTILFFQDFYSNDPVIIINGITWIIWFLGLTLVISIIPIFKKSKSK